LFIFYLLFFLRILREINKLFQPIFILFKHVSILFLNKLFFNIFTRFYGLIMMFFYIDLSDQILSSEAISPAFESKNVHECKKNSVYHQSCQISRKNFHESNRSIIYKLFVLTHKVVNHYNINCIRNDPKKNKVDSKHHILIF